MSDLEPSTRVELVISPDALEGGIGELVVLLEGPLHSITFGGVAAVDVSAEDVARLAAVAPVRLASADDRHDDRDGLLADLVLRAFSAGSASALRAHLLDDSRTQDSPRAPETLRVAAGSDEAFLAARAVQLFAPGRPQVDLVGLLMGETASETVTQRPSVAEVEWALGATVVQTQLALIGHRNTHPAFAGSLEIPTQDDGSLTMIWSDGQDWSRLDVNLATCSAGVAFTRPAGTVETLELAC